MNIVIIGDSWGISPFWVPQNEYKWLEYTLIDLGHTVFNRSRGGGENCWHLSDCLNFIENVGEQIKIDLIIWLHTELIRDLHLYEFAKQEDKDNIKTLDQLFDFIAVETYNKALLVKNATDAKWAIIGGHAPIRNHEDYMWADLLIKDWRSELVGEQLPESQLLSGLSWLTGQIEQFGKDAVELEIANYEKIVNVGKKLTPDVFFDGVHPNAEHCENLAKRIHNFFNSSS